MHKYYKAGTHELFFTSDTHFGHKNIIKYCDRPFATSEEMDEALIANWNSKVPTTGIVFVVGDFSMNCPMNRVIEIRKRLNGRIILIRGNHDDDVIKLNERHKIFEEIHTRLDIRVSYTDENGDTSYVDIELNHFPSLVWNNSHKGSYQGYGHVHSKEAIPGQDPFQTDVGVDGNNYTPLSLEDFCNKITKQRMEGMHVQS